MTNNHYQIYIDSVFSLAHTLSVKFEQAAEAINDKIMMQYGYNAVEKYNPSSWRYYQNISGQYHFINGTNKCTNSDIEIISLDTLQAIKFTKDNLNVHTATRQAYQYGSSYYKQLIEKYPDDELLIRGILYPCDINKAINSKDGTILSYPSYLVEDNEYDLIEKIQDWIYDYLHRWVNKQYALAHDLYVPMYMSQLYMHLVPVIINIRLQACKTPQAHSFHVRQYLASNLMLDKYLNYLTKEQALFFYRNIDYIKTHAGKREVFDWLVENIMTKRDLPLYDYDVRHDVSKIIASYDNDQVQNDRHTVIFRRLPINYPTIDPKRNIYNTSEILDRINNQAKGNPEYHKHEIINIENSLLDHKSNNIVTKLLESSITDYSQTAPYTIADILLNEWLSMSFTDRYNVYVTIEFPVTKEETTLTVKNAFRLFAYCMMKFRGIDTAITRKVIASRVQKIQPPSLGWMINYFKNSKLTTVQLSGVYRHLPPSTTVSSINEFYDRAYAIYNLNLQHYYEESKLEHYQTTGELKVANTQLFEDKIFNLLPDDITYDAWLKSYSYDFTEYDSIDYFNLALAIYSRATGSEANKKISIKEIQKAMVNLFLQLSSYSIQIIDNADSSPLLLVQDPGLKSGDIHLIENDNMTVEVPRVTVIDSYHAGSSKVNIHTYGNYTTSDVKQTEIHVIKITNNISTEFKLLQNPGDIIHIECSPIHVGLTESVL